MKPNMYCILRYQTSGIAEVHYFYDSTLRWAQLKDGRWIITANYIDHGKPTDEWLQNNPRPVR